ncbi:phage tail protein, partial [Yersinia enterocolitica]
MFGLDNASGVSTMPPIAPATSQTPLWFTEGGAGLQVSYPGQDWFNEFQAEHLNVLAAAGITPDKSKLNQLSAAIKKLITNGMPETPTLKSLGLTDIGIGLPSMTGIDNFDFQTFTFISGANYIASSTNWINVPSEISYPAGLAISIKVDYVTGTQIGLEIKPSTVSSSNFRAWYLRLGGYPGSRTFTAREIQTSANPVPISGGGTGATTAAGALAGLGLTAIGIGLPTQPTIANFDFQTFVFTSGANYAVSSSTWLNVPVEVVYPTGIIISITVISVPGSNVILKLVPHVSSAGKYNTYYVRMSGAAGSRTIYVTQDWNSSSPVPITGGGTGATTAAGALANLGLSDGSLVPIGVPLPYPLATPPAGFLKVNGSSFSTATYPKLALAYPSGVLPDLRGEFIRGFDDGRGVRADQNLLGWQGGGIQTHNHGLSNFEIRGITGGPTSGWFTSVNGLSTSNSGGDETRP